MKPLKPHVPLLKCDYWITDKGVVTNADTQTVLTAFKNASGKRAYSLAVTNPRGTKSFTRARLVAMVYLPNPEGKSEVGYIDGNNRNDALENLRWHTRTERLQVQKKRRGNRLFSAAQLARFRERRAAGESWLSIAESSGYKRTLGAFTALVTRSDIHHDCNWVIPTGVQSRPVTQADITACGVTWGELVRDTNGVGAAKKVHAHIVRNP